MKIEDMLKTKYKIHDLELESNELNKEIQKIYKKIKEITDNCNHEIIVFLNDEDILEDELSEQRCLCCGKVFHSDFPEIELNKCHIDATKMNGNSKEKYDYVFDRFIQIKMREKTLSDEEVIMQINREISDDKPLIYKNK